MREMASRNDCGPPTAPLRWSVATSQSTDDQGRQQIDAVMRATRVLVSVVARSLAEVEDVVTLPQFRVLVMIASDGPQNLGSVAAALGSTLQRDPPVRAAGRGRAGPPGRRPPGPPVPAAGPDRRGAPPRREGDAAPAYGDREGDGPLSPSRRRTVAAALEAFATAAGEVPEIEESSSSGWTTDTLATTRSPGPRRPLRVAPPLRLPGHTVAVSEEASQAATWFPCSGSGPRWGRPGPGHARRATR